MITFGSDAHAPAEVGYAFADALQWAKKAGYREYVIFEKRQIVDKIKI
jgi:histidinol phosphatase-like PHP family hydrolase